MKNSMTKFKIVAILLVIVAVVLFSCIALNMQVYFQQGIKKSPEDLSNAKNYEIETNNGVTVERWVEDKEAEELATYNPTGFTTFAEGTLLYEYFDKARNQIKIAPLKNVKVALWDKDVLVDNRIAETYTDENGHYSFQFENGHGLFENHDDIYIRCLSSGPTYNIFDFANYEILKFAEHLVNLDCGFTYYFESEILGNVESGENYEINMTLNYDPSSIKYKAFCVSQGFFAAQKFVDAQSDVNFGGKAYVYYPILQQSVSENSETVAKAVKMINETAGSDIDADEFVEKTSTSSLDDIQAFCIDRFICFREEYWDNYDTIMHEYGHFLEWRMGTYGINLIFEFWKHFDGHAGNEENIERTGKTFGMEFAWSEGWASAFAALAINYFQDLKSDAEYVENNGNEANQEFVYYDIANSTIDKYKDFGENYINYKSDPIENQGESQENNITALLFNLYCPYANNSANDFTLGYQEFFRTSAKFGTYTVSDFAENLDEEYAAYRNEIGNLFGKHRIAPSAPVLENENMMNIYNPPAITWVGNGSTYNPNNIFEIIFYNDDGEKIWSTGELLEENLDMTEVLVMVTSQDGGTDDENTSGSSGNETAIEQELKERHFRYEISEEDWHEALTAFADQYSKIHIAVAGYVDTCLSQLLKDYYKTGPYISGCLEVDDFKGLKVNNDYYYSEIEIYNETIVTFCGINYQNREEITSLSVPETINNNTVDAIGANAFDGCINLVNITIPDSITKIGKNAFSNTGLWNSASEGLICVGDWVLGYKGNLPSDSISLTENIVGIADNAFAGSTVETVSLNDGIRYIGDSAFEGCGQIANLSLPESVVYIGNNAFNNCSSLAYIDFFSVYPPVIGENAFMEDNNTIIIYVPKITENEYKTYAPITGYASNMKTREIKALLMLDDTVLLSEYSIPYYSYIDQLPAPSKNGYEFGGWYDSVSFENGRYENGDIWDKQSDTLLYAKWIPVSYTILYLYNGGTNVSNPENYTIEDSFTLLEPLKTGYSFVGWFNGDNKITLIEGMYENLQLEARWEANQYAVNLNINTSDAELAQDEIFITYDSEFSLPVPVRANYMFDGWFDGEQSGAVQYTDDSGNGMMTWDIAEEKTLYAHWTEKVYQIKIGEMNDLTGEWEFDKWWSETGLSDSAVVTTAAAIQEYFYTSMTAYFNSEEGLKPGHRFLSFYTSWDQNFANWTSAIPDLGDNNSVIYVYPEWEKEQYSVYYYNLGSIYASFENKDYNCNIAVTEPTRTGYEFAGWQISDASGAFSGTQFQNGNMFNYTKMPDLTPTSQGFQAILLNAVWIPKQTQIVFESISGQYQSLTATYDKEVSGLVFATANGYTFHGWYDQPNGEGKKYSNGTRWDKDAPQCTLYAYFTIITYSISYNLNSGDNNGGNPSSYTVESSIILKDAVRKGYKFAGWKNTNGDVVTSIGNGNTGNLTLTANWIGSYINANNIAYTNISLANCGADVVILDFKDCNSTINKVYNIAKSINEITIKDTNRNLQNLSFVIDLRSTPLTLKLWDIQFTAQNDNNAIKFSSSADLTIYSYSDYNKITGGKITNNTSQNISAINAESAKVIIAGDDDTSLNIWGGNGADGTYITRNGLQGGFGINVKSLEITIPFLIVVGGSGGDGDPGSRGNDGIDGADAPSSGGGQTGAKGGNGTNGTDGEDGGNGGDGQVAVKCSSGFKVKAGSTVKCYGGDGGNGGYGGRGGDGGDGGDGRDAKFAVFSGDGGDGGNGGNGGDGGNGGNGANAIAGTVNGNVETHVGEDGLKGTGGSGGAGGAAGAGGKYLGQDKWRASGDPGDPGRSGSDGSGR